MSPTAVTVILMFISFSSLPPPLLFAVDKLTVSQACVHCSRWWRTFVIFLEHKEFLRLFSLSLTFHVAGDLVSVNTSSGTATLTSSSFLGVTSQVLYHWFGEPFHYFVNNISMCSGPVFQMVLLKLFTEDTESQNNMTHNPTPPLNSVTLELRKINYT